MPFKKEEDQFSWDQFHDESRIQVPSNKMNKLVSKLPSFQGDEIWVMGILETIQAILHQTSSAPTKTASVVESVNP